MENNFQNLSNHEVIVALKQRIAEEKKLDSEILELLKEVKHRKIHLAKGYSNLADYCTLELGLPEHSAWKRSQAVDVVKEHPWALDMLKKGSTKVSQLAMLRSKITKHNEQIIKDFIPEKSKSELKEFLETVGPKGERLTPSDKVELKLKCPKTLIEKLRRIRSLKTKSKFMPPLEEVMEEMADLWLQRNDAVEKAKRAQARAEKKVSIRPGANERIKSEEKTKNRYIPAKIKHRVLLKSHQGCAWISPEGRRCGSKHRLQIDHQIAFAAGGEHSEDNCRVLCAAHNQYYADLTFGREFMDEKRGH